MKTRRLRQLHLQNNKLKCISDRAFDKLKARSRFRKILDFQKFFKFLGPISVVIENFERA